MKRIIIPSEVEFLAGNAFSECDVQFEESSHLVWIDKGAFESTGFP